eukprot:m.48778 g.48778  ORF g.48778 m.48778 type:complete len:172 (-) comp7036_c0_seq1:77-592(-)
MAAASKTTLVLVRHGKTEWNAAGRFQGQMDSPLLPEGCYGAEALGRRIKADNGDLGNISAVYTSDLRRAHHTAEMIMLASGLIDAGVPLMKDSRLREIAFGELEGQQRSELSQQHRDFFSRWTFETRTPGGGESCAHVADRMEAAVNDVCTGFVCCLRFETALGLPMRLLG